MDLALKAFESGAQGRAGVQPKVFYDLGSGVGRPVFAAAILHPFTYVAGVELLEVKSDSATCRCIMYSAAKR